MNDDTEDGLVVSVSASHAEGCVFASRSGHTKDHLKIGKGCFPAWDTCVMIGVLTVQPVLLNGQVVCGTLWGHVLQWYLKRSPGINSKGRVSYPGPRFPSSIT